MSNSISAQARAEFPKGWWRSAHWWGAAIKRDFAALVVIAAPALLPNKAVQAVRHRRDPKRLAQINGEGFAYGFFGAVWVIVMLIWVTAGRAEMLPLMLGLGCFSILNAVVAGTVVGVLIASWIRRRRIGDAALPSTAPTEPRA